MEQYSDAAKIPLDEQVSITNMYLTGDAKLWWRTRICEDEDGRWAKIKTWENLKQVLKQQFLSQNASRLARNALKVLKHTSSIREYVKEFNSSKLDIRNMSKDDKLFNFLSGFQPWAQAELRRQNISDITAAIAAADALVDFKATTVKAKGSRINLRILGRRMERKTVCRSLNLREKGMLRRLSLEIRKAKG